MFLKRLLLISAFFLIAAPLMAGENTLDVHRTSPSVIRSLPGKIVTAAFSVRNGSKKACPLSESAQAPPGWAVVVPSGVPFTLDGGSEQIKFVTVRLPQKAAAGTYKITYEVRRNDSGGATGESFSIEVLPLHRLDSAIDETPEMRIAGEHYDVKLHVVNRGNSTETVKLTLKSVPQNFSCLMEPSALSLEPGQSAPVLIKVKTDSEIRTQTFHIITFRAELEHSPPENPVFTEKTANVKIVPRISGVFDPFIRLKCFLKLANANENGADGIQGEFSGQGELDEEGKRRIDFLFRTPDLMPLVSIADRDECRFNYYTRPFDLLLGDETFSLSPLTENYKYGRGIACRYRKGSLEAGGMQMATRWNIPQEYETGFYLRKYFNDCLSLKGNMLQKSRDLAAASQGSYVNGYINGYVNIYLNGSISGTVNAFVTGYGYVTGAFDGEVSGTVNGYVNGYMSGYGTDYGSNTSVFTGAGGLQNSWNNGQIYSIQGLYDKGQKFSLESEFGQCTSNSGGSATDSAYRVLLNGMMPGDTAYSFERVHAGPRYFGYYSDVDYTNGSVNFPVAGKVKGYLTYRSYQDNLSLDSARTVANYEETYQGGLSWSSPQGLTLSLEGEDYTKRDDYMPTEFYYRTKRVRMGAGKNWKNCGIQAFVDKGEIHDWLVNLNTPLDRVALFANYTPSPALNCSLYMINGDNNFYSSPDKSTTVGGSLSFSLKKNLTITTSYERYRFNGDKQRETYYTHINYKLKNEHVLSLWGRTMHGNDIADDSVALLTYTMPLGIPVARKKHGLCALKGIVYDAETGTKTPLANIVLRVENATAVTEKNGTFLFPALTPGEHYLSLDKASIGLKRVSSCRTPIRFTAKSAETASIDIGVIRSCRLAGKVTLFAPSADSGTGTTLFAQGKEAELVPQRGLPSLLVEMTMGDESVRQLTDNNGNFCFYDMRPGKWTVKVYDDDLPDLHYIEPGTMAVTLAPGDAGDASFRVLPRKRTIRIIDQGDVKQDRK